MEVDALVGLCHLGFKTDFLEQKCYRTNIGHINKVGSTHFEGGNATFVLAK
jgi:hypothetical protein